MDLETGSSDMVLAFDEYRDIRLLDDKVFFDEPTGRGDVIRKQKYYDLKTNETKEASSPFSDTEVLTIMEEIGDKFFGYIARYEGDYATPIGNLMNIYIEKEDYYDGMKKIVEISDTG